MDALDSAPQGNLGLRANLGYEFGNGLQTGLVWDALGTRSALLSQVQLQGFEGGVRYRLPLLPQPYMEASLGLCVVDPLGFTSGQLPGQVGAIAELGAGVAIPLGRRFSFLLGVRNWLVVLREEDVDVVGVLGGIEVILPFPAG